MNQSILHYPESELELKDKIEQLNDKWRDFLKIQLSNEYADCIEDFFVTDGFYPYYTYKKKKILFIGREALEIGGLNYMELLYKAYQEKRIGSKTLNQHKFHSTMLYLTYAIERGVYKWEEIPSADKFISEFAQPKGISNAFMNLSKFSNESGRWAADNNLIDSFIEASKKSPINFFATEIDLLAPDIIFGMNFSEERMKCLGKFEFESPKMYGNNDVCFHILTTPSGKTYPYLDCWHFSAPNKKTGTDIFNPAIEALQDNGIIM